MGILFSFFRNTDGNFAVMTAIAAVPLLAAVGLGITYTQFELVKNEMQQELDAAVLAGTALGYSSGEKARLNHAYSMIGNVERTFASSSDADVNINGLSTFAVNGTSVSGVSRSNMPNSFAGFVGESLFAIKVTATAVKQQSSPVCLLALNPKEERSVEIYGNSTVSAENCAVMANSDDAEGIKQYGNKSSLHASKIGVTGSYAGDNLVPEPQTDLEPYDDPHASLPVPEAGDCLELDSKISSVETELQPGTYCGGLTISPQAKVTLRPGIYIFKDGVLSIGANSTLSGTEVLLAFVGYDSTLYAGSGSSIKLSSPKSGTYQNIQMMSDREANGKFKGEEWFVISSSTLEYDGVMYLPEQDIWIKGGSQITANSPTIAMVGDQFWFQDTSDVKITNENKRNLDIKDLPQGFKFGALLVD